MAKGWPFHIEGRCYINGTAVGRTEILQRNAHRIGAIDGLRGIAAVVVAFVYHWQHLGGKPPLQVWFLAPHPLQWLQIYGWLGVDLFFLLSGFIFAQNYAASISSGRVGGREFFVRRFSRLYPLHLATLIVTAVIVWWMWWTLGEFPIYEANDLYHFFLNLIFAQSIGLENDFSFNGPSWSLSLEAVCYAFFFVVCQHATKNRQLMFVALAFLGAALLKIHPPTMPLISMPVGRALTGFFCGCLICTATNAGVLPWLRWAALATLSFGAFTALLLGSLRNAIGTSFYLPFDLVIFPCLLICCLGFAPLRYVLSSRPFQLLGDLSYSIYLLHAVVQMALIFFFRYYQLPIPATSFWFFASYVIGVVVLSMIVHRYFEMPAQAWLRERLLIPRPGVSAPILAPSGAPPADTSVSPAVFAYSSERPG